MPCKDGLTRLPWWPADDRYQQSDAENRQISKRGVAESNEEGVRMTEERQGEEAREKDGKRDRGEMRGAIARWTPEGRVYFDNRYHRRRCYRVSYRSAPHTVNGQQIERERRVCACTVYACVCVFYTPVRVDSRASSASPFHFLFTLHLSFSCRTRFQAIMWLLYHK